MEGKEGKIFCQSMTDDERRNVFGEGYFAYLANSIIMDLFLFVFTQLILYYQKTRSGF